MNDTFSVLVNLSPYHALEEGVAWIEALKGRAEHEGLDYFLALPFDVLNYIASTSAPSFLVYGAQFMNPVNPGSFTETISVRLLTNFGAKFVLLGTQRSRLIEGESNTMIGAKIKRAKAEGVAPILFVGETAEERRLEKSAEILTRQIGESTQECDVADLMGLQIVYEAPWIKEMPSRPLDEEIDHAYQFCRELIHSLFGEPLASSVKVYCPVPIDHLDVETFIHTLHADGFYFCDPHQLANIDEASLRTKAETARKAEEVAAVIAAVETPVEQMAEEASKEVESVEEVNERPQQLTEVLDEVNLPEEIAVEEKTPEEAAALKTMTESGASALAEPVEEEEVEELQEIAEPSIIEPTSEEEIKEETVEEKKKDEIRDVTITDLNVPIAKARRGRPRKKKTEE